MLDRVVLGPFLPPIEFLVSDSSDFKKFLVEHPKEIRKNDSMNKIIRNTNYFVAYKVHKTISDSTWAVFSNLLLKSKFWQRQSFFYNERISLDGDVWVLEGHIKSGYKLIEMNIPYCNIPYKFESNDKTLLRYFLKLAGLDEKKYKIY